MGTCIHHISGAIFPLKVFFTGMSEHFQVVPRPTTHRGLSLSENAFVEVATIPAMAHSVLSIRRLRRCGHGKLNGFVDAFLLHWCMLQLSRDPQNESQPVALAAVALSAINPGWLVCKCQTHDCFRDVQVTELNICE